MRHLDFYNLAAQVLPTLLIVLMLELRAIMTTSRRTHQRLDQLEHEVYSIRQKYEEAKVLGSEREKIAYWAAAGLAQEILDRVSNTWFPIARRRGSRWLTFMVMSMPLFVLGEAAALLVVFVGTNGWMVWVAAPVVGLALFVFILAVVTVPLAVFAASVDEELADEVARSGLTELKDLVDRAERNANQQ